MQRSVPITVGPVHFGLVLKEHRNSLNPTFTGCDVQGSGRIGFVYCIDRRSFGQKQLDEFGFVADDAGVVTCCSDYFARLWSKAGQNLSFEKLDSWEKKVTDRLAKGARPSGIAGLGDEGVDVGESPPPIVFPPWAAEAPQAFVKFFGISSGRVELTLPIFAEVERSGCHWACTYPKDKRPRQVDHGALIFVARLVKEPNDIIIFGRAVAMTHSCPSSTPSPVAARLSPMAAAAAASGSAKTANIPSPSCLTTIPPASVTAMKLSIEEVKS